MVPGKAQCQRCKRVINKAAIGEECPVALRQELNRMKMVLISRRSTDVAVRDAAQHLLAMGLYMATGGDMSIDDAIMEDEFCQALDRMESVLKEKTPRARWIVVAESHMSFLAWCKNVGLEPAAQCFTSCEKQTVGLELDEYLGVRLAGEWWKAELVQSVRGREALRRMLLFFGQPVVRLLDKLDEKSV
jgi:hypothetical protein